MSEAVKQEFKRIPLTPDGKLIKNAFNIKSPQNLVIVKYPKSGGTLAMCNVDKLLIADSEKGTNYFSPDNVARLTDEELSNKFTSTTNYGWVPDVLHDLIVELHTANNMTIYKQKQYQLENERDLKVKERLYHELIEMINNMPFPILAIDTITSFTNISNLAALHEYNSNTKSGVKKTDIKRVDEYGGVQYIRRKFDEIKRFIEDNAAPFIQYHGHVGFKKKTIKKNEEDMNALDIALEGLLSYSFTAKADAICTLFRDKDGVWMDFTKQEETDLGSRPAHLSNKKIKIAELLKEGENYPKTYWGDIYPEIEAFKNK